MNYLSKYCHDFWVTWVWCVCRASLSRGHQQALFFCILELWFQSCLATVTVTAETALILLFKPLQLGDVRSGTMVTTTVVWSRCSHWHMSEKPWRLHLNIQAVLDNDISLKKKNLKKLSTVLSLVTITLATINHLNCFAPKHFFEPFYCIILQHILCYPIIFQ